MTSISESLVQRFALYGSVAINVVLVLFIGTQLRVTPSEILNEVRTQASTIIEDSTDIRKDLAHLREEMDSNKEWMRVTDGVISKLTTEALKKQEFTDWCNKAIELNPGFKPPEGL